MTERPFPETAEARLHRSLQASLTPLRWAANLWSCGCIGSVLSIIPSFLFLSMALGDSWDNSFKAAMGWAMILGFLMHFGASLFRYLLGWWAVYRFNRAFPLGTAYRSRAIETLCLLTTDEAAYLSDRLLGTGVGKRSPSSGVFPASPKGPGVSPRPLRRLHQPPPDFPETPVLTSVPPVRDNVHIALEPFPEEGSDDKTSGKEKPDE